MVDHGSQPGGYPNSGCRAANVCSRKRPPEQNICSHARCVNKTSPEQRTRTKHGSARLIHLNNMGRGTSVIPRGPQSGLLGDPRGPEVGPPSGIPRVPRSGPLKDPWGGATDQSARTKQLPETEHAEHVHIVRCMCLFGRFPRKRTPEHEHRFPNIEHCSGRPLGVSPELINKGVQMKAKFVSWQQLPGRTSKEDRDDHPKGVH